jgi:hypothetical protein
MPPTFPLGHTVVQVGNDLYDPSYGNHYSGATFAESLTKFAKQSLFGVFSIESKPDGVTENGVVRVPPKSANVMVFTSIAKVDLVHTPIPDDGTK